MATFPTNYRLVMLKTIAMFIGRPLLLAGMTWALFLPQVSKYYFSLIYIIAVPTYWTLEVQYKRFLQKRDAISRGAICAPEINGKWLGNIDLIPK